MRPKRTTLTPQELEIMKLVWQRGSATVRDVYEALLERRKIAYTSVMTMMKILETKGCLKRRRRDRALAERTESSHRARTTVRQDRRGMALTDCFKITRVQNRAAGKSVASNCK